MRTDATDDKSQNVSGRMTSERRDGGRILNNTKGKGDGESIQTDNISRLT